MKYTQVQIQQIKKAFDTREARAILAKITDDCQARQIANGLRRVSLQRAKKIAAAFRRKELVRLLMPELP